MKFPGITQEMVLEPGCSEARAAIAEGFCPFSLRQDHGPAPLDRGGLCLVCGGIWRLEGTDGYAVKLPDNCRPVGWRHSAGRS